MYSQTHGPVSVSRAVAAIDCDIAPIFGWALVCAAFPAAHDAHLQDVDIDSLPEKFNPMTIAQSRVTAQGQISVPAAVRKKLGVGPGSVLEWHEQDGRVMVRRAGRFSSAEIHQTLFPNGAQKGTRVVDVKKTIRKYI